MSQPHADRVRIDHVSARTYRIPTDRPESDGTFEWSATTIVVALVRAGGRTGIGYSYTAGAAATLIRETLADVLVGRDAWSVPACYDALVAKVRNVGRPGVATDAISALDFALWDLKAKLLDVPLATLLGAARESVPVYGSGGFTSYSVDEVCEQLGGWADSGIARVKMKVGRDPASDPRRVRAARAAIGRYAELFVDANGAYTRKQALALAERFAEQDVKWFEEPVSSDDLEGLRLIRDRGPAGMAIAAGEYGFDPYYFRRMIEAGAVDVLQADGTRCGGVTGFLRAAALCDAWGIPLSAHTAPSAHLHVCCAAPRVVHLELFHDHVRVERALFDGAAASPRGGELYPDLTRPGLGLELKEADAARLAA